MREVFLLGGYDLEMLEIKKLLESHQKAYFDHKLSWGAKLSDYEGILNESEHFIGIELEEDMPPPKQYQAIDHHGSYSHLPSAIEQIAELLGIALSRDQKLIAANDSGYIEGMRKVCASDEEIDAIRKRDREAQGVSSEDEALADLSIKDSANSSFIKALTPKFSAISDKVYERHKKYVIYNESALTFYGYEIKQIQEFLSSQSISEHNCFYGGGAFGFIGIKNGALPSKEIEHLVEEFKTMEENREIISQHTYMLPFILECDEKELLSSEWSKSSDTDYNEIAYFHPFFRKSMALGEDSDNSERYIHNTYKNCDFIICQSKEYHLTLTHADLRLFDTGVGIVSLHLENYKHNEIKDILEINDYGRRIYPEYLDEQCKCTLVPHFVKLKDQEEYFQFDNRPKAPKLSKIITLFLDEDKIRPAVDDRMFVMSFYKNSTFSNDLKRDYIKNDSWYEYVYIDGNGKTVQNEEMQKGLIKKASYSRWQGYGTMYGVSKYSFVCIAEKSEFIENTVEKHMKTMYFQMFTLLLMVRATILRFSSEVSDIAKEIDKKGTSEKVSDLYKRYIKFVNNFYFREITAKDQGLEIYEKALAILNIERDIKDLDAEIEELHKYVELKEDQKSSNAINRLNYIGFGFILITTLTGILGMNILPKEFEDWFKDVLLKLFEGIQ